MNRPKLAKMAALVVLLCFTLALVTEYVEAAKGDQAIAQKQGIALGEKKTDESKKPSKLQMAIGVGSLFVAFAVIKWL